MSKIVVGMNSRPEITPQMIDCGLRKTVFIACAEPRTPPAGAFFSDGGRRRYSTTLMTRPAMPIAIQKVLQGTPDAIAGPTRNCPADPPAMPNICVAPMSVAARDAGKFVVAM